MKKTIIAGAAALGLTLSGGLSSVSAAGYPGHYVKNGNHGSSVTAVQKQLSKRGFYLATDGIFDPRTLDDVKDFQKMHGLSIDGIIGPKTWNSLWNTSTHSGSSDISQTLKMGSRGQQVKDLQGKLNQIGDHAGTVDGIYGSMTKQAVMKFQRQHHLQVDGIYGPKTRKALQAINMPHSTYPGPYTKYGDRGSNIKKVQEAINQDAYPAAGPLKNDGIFGSRTLKFVKGFQKEYHLKADGIVGPKTWNVLFSPKVQMKR